MSNYDKTIFEIRKFNRFYTVTMGLLNSDYLDTKYSIAETRILFEIHTLGTCIQSDIAQSLHIDKSYLSRLIKRFEKNGLIVKHRAEDDRRATRIMLSEKGNEEAGRLIALTNHYIEEQLGGLASEECEALCSALHTVMSILGKGKQSL